MADGVVTIESLKDAAAHLQVYDKDDHEDAATHWQGMLLLLSTLMIISPITIAPVVMMIISPIIMDRYYLIPIAMYLDPYSNVP